MGRTCRRTNSRSLRLPTRSISASRRRRASCATCDPTGTACAPRDLADWLVRVAGLPFRQAHHATGAIVRQAEARGCTLAELPLAVMQAVEPAITAAVYDVLDVDRSVASRMSFGGTAPKRVRAAVVEARKQFLG